MTKKSKSEPKPDDDNKVVKPEITKPKASVFERFRSRKPPTIGGVGELLQPLPLLKVSDANDFVRLSPSPEHWSPELCFVSVPVHGEKRDILHLIDEEIAVAICRRRKSSGSGWHWPRSLTTFSSWPSCRQRTWTIPGTPRWWRVRAGENPLGAGHVAKGRR